MECGGFVDMVTFKIQSSVQDIYDREFLTEIVKRLLSLIIFAKNLRKGPDYTSEIHSYIINIIQYSVGNKAKKRISKRM